MVFRRCGYAGGAAIAFNRGFVPRENKGPRTNDEITAREVRLIGADGSQVGIVNIRKALQMAEDEGLDLVEVAPDAKPPVCKVIDYNKYRYEQSKKLKDARKKQHTVQLKRIQLGPKIDDHDFQVKVNAARRFIEAGNRVKVIMLMRGRMVTRREIAEEVLNRFVTELEDIAKPEGDAKMEAINNISLMLVKRK